MQDIFQSDNEFLNQFIVSMIDIRKSLSKLMRLITLFEKFGSLTFITSIKALNHSFEIRIVNIK